MIVSAFAAEFQRYRALAEGAVAQLPFEQLRGALDPESNSIAVIMKHVGGNLRSRWTDPFNSDGEKPWRNRDSEFIDDFPDRATLEAWWKEGWRTLEGLLATVSDHDLARTVSVRGEPHTLAQALARSLAHTAWHCGQIVQVARHFAHAHGVEWRTLTIPRGGSEAFNWDRGYDGGEAGGGHASR